MVIKLWTDGSAVQRVGGGFAVLDENYRPIIMGREDKSTNIRMEGIAIICAMAFANGSRAIIHTDSQFWINVLTKYAPVWESNGWTKKGGIKNLDLVKPAYDLYTSGKTELVWVKGHSEICGNEEADEWANRARAGRGVTGAMLFNFSEIELGEAIKQISLKRRIQK